MAEETQPKWEGKASLELTAVKAEQKKKTTKWAKEKLAMIDPIQRCLSYQLIDNNIGFKSYVATIKVLPINIDGCDGENGCTIEWSFVADPIEGWRPEDLTSFIENRLQIMSNKIEQALVQTWSPSV
ncbi:hypothetical protein Dsin_017714 [Dipteronia sinensis]|uniref:Lachrymatory-factor synthase-like n=1 Tax=Dipteronia sinensis TaxID=43782 RepID=A0AAE0E863_9ROSI|nr:hypothetical protein Dsin_017714 [Dipteronia sinensis]